MPTVTVDYYVTQGDFGKVMEMTLLNADEEPVDLSSATVTLHLGDARSGTLIVDGGVVEPDGDQVANTGVARYTWTEAATAEAGYFEGVVRARWGSSQQLTHPTDPRIRVLIKRKLGS